MKKRYSLTLTKENVEELQEFARSMNLSPSIVSDTCEEAILKTLQIFRKVKNQGSLSITDVFTMIGEQIEEAEKEVSNDKKFCPDCGRPWHQFHNCELNPVANPD